MKRLIFVLLILFAGSQAFPQFGLDKLKKVKDAVDTGKKVVNAVRPITEEEEYYIGRAVAAQILAKFRLLKNEALTMYLGLVGSYLAMNSGRPEIFNGYRFAVLDTDEVNAFAAPGGIIFLTRGLIKSCGDEDELAAVMAHEISHVVSRDPIKAIKQSRITSLAGMAADVAIGGSAAVDLLKDTVGDIAGTLIEKGYSRGQEKEADLSALDLLAQSGYSPAALLTILQKQQANEAKKMKIFSAHPPAKERCSYTQKELKSYKAPAVAPARTARFDAFLKLAKI